MIDLWIGFYSPLRARSSLGLIRRSLIDLWSSSTRKSCLLFLQVCVQDAAAPIHKKPPKNFRKNAEEVKKKRSRWIDPSYWCLSCSTQQSHINTNKTKIRQKCESIVCRLWAKGGEQSCRIALCSDRKKKKKRDQISWGALLASPLFIGWQVQRKQHGMI